MNGRKTAVILGAGASFCYQDGSRSIPIQADIIGRLFMGLSMSPGIKLGAFSGPFGLDYSDALGKFLRSKFGIPESAEKPLGSADYWEVLQRRGYTLETLYGELEADQDIPRAFLEDFEAIVRTAVRTPAEQRAEKNVCRHHAKLCEALEPGDYIVNFNWDSLMADALLYRSYLWFPATGFGFPVRPMVKIRQKQIPNVESLVELYHVHGSVVLFETPMTDRGEKGRWLLYLGPDCYGQLNSLLAASGIDASTLKGNDLPEPAREVTEEEHRRIRLGHLYVEKPWLQPRQWFSPVFTPPSRFKNAGAHWYTRRLTRRIHTLLPSTIRILLAGYSLPPADTDHFRGLFPPQVMHPDLEVTVVNPAVKDPSFLSRIREFFPEGVNEGNLWEDFRAFCDQC